jgi:hypothetical protein
MRSLYQPQTPFVVTTQAHPSPPADQPQAKPQTHKARREPPKKDNGFSLFSR